MTNEILDRICGVFFALVGTLTVWGSIRMPRFEERGAEIYQAPGLTPGLLGIALVACGLVLAIRRGIPNGETLTFWNSVFGSAKNRHRAFASVTLVMIYGAVLFGQIPYTIATFFFVATFIVVFEVFLPAEGKKPNMMKTIVAAVVLAAITALGTRFVFQNLFLVQLP